MISERHQTTMDKSHPRLGIKRTTSGYTAKFETGLKRTMSFSYFFLFAKPEVIGILNELVNRPPWPA